MEKLRAKRKAKLQTDGYSCGGASDKRNYPFLWQNPEYTLQIPIPDGWKRKERARIAANPDEREAISEAAEDRAKNEEVINNKYADDRDAVSKDIWLPSSKH